LIKLFFQIKHLTIKGAPVVQRNFLTKISITLLATCSINTHSASSDSKTIDKVVQTYIHAYEKKDLRTIAPLYAPQAVAIGTGSDEVIRGRDRIIPFLKRDFAQSTDATISSKKIAIDVQNNTAFASYFMNVKVKLPDSAPFESKLRFTLGLLKENNEWKIVQSHCSAPIAVQKSGESFPRV
jgi:uncharacterized protein (TIGR02246 family)